MYVPKANTKRAEESGLVMMEVLGGGNKNRIAIAQIHINLLRNKYSLLCEAVCGNIDILLVTETKLDSSFPSAQFHMHGYTIHYRLDRNATGGGLLLYVRENIPSKKINNVDFDTSLEPISIEINIWKT